MKEYSWLRQDVVIAIHERVLADYGGQSGIREPGLLDSALARPRQILAYDKPDFASLTTAYAAGIIRNHPFVDGNKRVGFMAAYVFLATNGHTLTATELTTTQTVLDLAAGKITEPMFAQWLRENSNPT